MWNPKNVNSVLKLGNSVSAISDNELTIKNLKSDPDTKTIIESKYGVNSFNIEELHKLPKETLGYTFAQYVKVNNLNPNFYNKHTDDLKKSDYAYLVYRMRKTHDIWHIITGFDTTEAGEAGLIAFYYAQLKTPLSRLIIVLSFIHFLIRKPTEVPALLDAISTGWKLGNKSKPLLAIRWEEIFNQPLALIQKNLGISP